MTILPLIGRQLRVRARSPAVYWIRFGAVLAGSLVCLTTLSGSYWGTPLGAASFGGLVAASFILCCFSGSLTVDGISRERREGTLGLLFLTHVGALDVLAANFAAAGIASLWALGALTPLLIVLVLFADVSGGEVARTVFALIDTMILSLAAGLWASAGGRKWWSCVASAAALLALVIFGPALLEWPGPLKALAAAGEGAYKSSAAAYWASIAVVLAISWLLLIRAGQRLRRASCEDDVTPAPSVHSTPARSVNYSPRREPIADGEAPMDWLLRRQNDLMPLVWTGALLGTAFCGGLFFMPDFMSMMLTSPSSWGVTLVISIVEGCLFGWAASRFLIEARRTGEMELLLTIPEGARTIVASQWKWLKGAFGGPLAVFVAPWVLLSFIDDMQWGVFRGSALMPVNFEFYSIPAQLLSCVNTLTGIVALLWAGVWLGWSERSQIRAIVRIVVLAKGVPYLIGLPGLLAAHKLASMNLPFAGHSGSILTLVWSMPQVVILLFYIGLIRWARRRLAGELPQSWPEV
jgi:hypothetical protein